MGAHDMVSGRHPQRRDLAFVMLALGRCYLHLFGVAVATGYCGKGEHHFIVPVSALGGQAPSVVWIWNRPDGVRWGPPDALRSLRSSVPLTTTEAPENPQFQSCEPNTRIVTKPGQEIMIYGKGEQVFAIQVYLANPTVAGDRYSDR
jgi:hypothetical protein